MFFTTHPRRVFSCLYNASFLNSFAFYSISTLIPLYITDSLDRGGLGLPIETGVNLYSTFFGISFLTPFLGGWLSDLCLSKKSTLIVGEFVSLCALALLFFFKQQFLECALIFLAFGYGFSRTALTSLVGTCAADHGSCAKKTYKDFYLSLCFGFITAAFLGGYLYTYFSFSIILKLLFVLLGLSSLFSCVLPSQPISTETKEQKSIEDSSFVSSTRFFIFILMASIPFFVCYVQMTTSMSLYLHHHVNRTFGSFEMPTVWLNALGSLIVTATAAISSREHEKSTFTELRTTARGLAKTALAFFLLFITVALAPTSDSGTILAFLVSYILLCIADLVIRPQLFSAVSTYIPPQKRGLMIGLVYLVIGVGVKLGGCLAAAVGTCGYAFLFGSLTLASSTICLSLLAFDKKSRAQAIFSRKAPQQSNQEEASPL